MNKKTFNRREFLQRFALLSSAPIVTIGLSGCGSSGADPVYGPSPAPVYGPPPADEISPEVDGMYIHDPQVGNGILNNATDVPIDSSFEVEFTKQMDSESINAIHLDYNDDNTQVAIEGSWLTPLIALIEPMADLNHGGIYTLYVDETAKDLDGNLIDLMEMSDAQFKTA
jgi:hypothetical protein